MNLLAESAGTSTFSFSVPDWVLWGLGLSVVIIIGLYAGAWIFARIWETMTFGFMGTAKDMEWPKLPAAILAYLTYGLIPSLLCSYIWAGGNPVLGVFAGLGIFFFVWLIWTGSNKRSSY